MKKISSHSLGKQGDVAIESLHQFCINQKQPLVFTGLFDALPELTQWGSAKLRQLLGNRQVMVNVSESGLFNRSQMQAMPFQEYADYLELPPEEKKDIRYMQQQSISGGLANGCFPELSALVAIDRYFPEHAIWEQNLWFGPAGCMTGLHFDIPKNFFMQIEGRKKFYLVPPNSRNKLYAYPAMSVRPNFSRVDLTSNFETEFPLVAQTERYEITLEPGSLLYLPECWWHQVLSLENALSVNIWANSRWVGLLQEQIASLPIMGRGLIGTVVNLFHPEPMPTKPVNYSKQVK